MIPHKLQLKNFLSYGDEIQTIDFSPYQLICLSGKNGHGKSALLDAITWALWGSARKTSGTSKADQGLLRLGQTHMMVIFDFEINNTMYRVKREFALTHGKPYANLEFGVLDIATDSMHALTDKKIRSTQDRIDEVLHLNFDSFCNSAFLRQGQANEFSKKSPKERKEVFATILGLNQYEELRKRAMEKAKEATDQEKTLEALQERLTHDLTQKDELEKNITQLAEQLNALSLQEKNYATIRLELEKKATLLAKEHKEQDALVFQQTSALKEKQRVYDEAHALFTAWRQIHHTQRNLADRTILEKDKARLSADIAQHQTKLQKGLQLKEQYLLAKEQLQTIEQAHLAQHSQQVQLLQLERERTVTEQKAAQKNYADVSKAMAESHQKITVFKKPSAQSLEELEAQFEKRKAHYQQWVAQGNWLREQQAHIDQKNALTHDEKDPSCPLCEQNLSASRKRFLRQKLEDEQRLVTHQLTRLTAVISRLKDILIAQHDEMQKLRLHLEEKKKWEQLETERVWLDKALEDYALTLGKQELALTQTIATAKKTLLENPDHIAASTTIENVKKTAQEIQYNAEKHKQDQAEFAAIEQKLAQQAHIEKERTLQDERLKAFETHQNNYKKLLLAVATVATELKKFEHLATIEKELTTQRASLTSQELELVQTKEQLLQEKGRLENQRQKLKQLELEFKNHEASIKALKNQIDDYQMIASATGKNGLQALLIEEAIPEVEHEANQLLAKLTDNQAQIFIESLRDLKKGGTKETLDIKISDSAGIRPYELFSGGEAFRIDFALRIAISKLLARRAGAALQTLIIDEGFGSQDEEGLAHIMDAIYKIQDDFSKVIIVSHLPTMKDQFPVHFVVHKGTQGSTVSVLEQG